VINRLITALTSGPTNRYRWALFVEKEGFGPLLEEAGIAERFDIAVMSTKGMSTTASRLLVEKLSRKGVTVLVARDFDKAGFSIVHTMHADTRRYQFSRRPRVVDIGLRLGDVREMGLDHEPVDYRGSTSPAINLRECGTTDEEIDFLVYPSYYGGSWAGWWQGPDRRHGLGLGPCACRLGEQGNPE
jgi:hypothetical protein